MVELVNAILPILLLVLRGVLGLAVVLAVVNAGRNFYRSRSAPYFVLRRAALVRAGRWMVVVLGAGAALAVAMRVRPPVVAEVTPRAPAIMIEATSPPPAGTPAPSAPPPSTPEVLAQPGANPTGSSPTRVPSPTPSPLFVTRESDVTPQVDASLSITAIATGIDANFLPENPGSTFEAGTPRLYVFYDFEGMTDGASWSGVLLVNGQVFEEASFDQLWSLGSEGTNLYRWFDRDGGWPAGAYEIRFFIGDRLADSATFRIVETPDESSS